MNTSMNKNAAQPERRFSQVGAWAKLSYPQKFTIITLIFALPILAFAPLAYEQLLRIDRYGQKEEAGTIYLRNLWQLNNSLQEYGTISLDFQSGNATAEDLENSRARVETSLQALQANEEIAAELGLAYTTNLLRSKWNLAQSPDQFDPLMNDVSAAIREVGDKSYLILDPDLDTYYLMDAVLLRLPENQNSLFSIKQLSHQAIRNGGLTPSEENELQNNLNTILENIDQIERGLKVASENNTNQAFNPALQDSLATYKINVESYAAIIQQLSEAEATGTLDEVHRIAASSESDFYNAASIALERGIQNRITTFTSEVTLYIALSIFSAVLAFIIGNRLMNSISTPLQKTIQAAEQFATGNLSTRIHYTSEDEAGRVIQAFNKLAEEVESKQAALQLRSDDLEDKTRKLETISRVSREITSFRDLSSVLTAAANLVHENFGHYHVGIFLLDERKEYAMLTATNSEGGRKMIEKGHTLKVGETGIVGYVAESLQARIALDVGSDAVYFNNPDMPETRSEMALPLVVNGQILGVLDIQSKQAMAFKQEDIPTLQILAEQLAIAIQNANLFSEAQKALEAASLAYGEQSREAWSKILRSQEKVGFIATPPGTVKLEGENVEAALAKAIESGDLIHGTDGLTISIPVKIRGQVIGAIRLKKSEITEAWSQDETNLAISLADQLSGALESARLYRDSLQRAARESLVSEISARITASATRDAIIRETVQELGQSIENVSVTFQLLDHSNGEKQAQGAERSA